MWTSLTELVPSIVKYLVGSSREVGLQLAINKKQEQFQAAAMIGDNTGGSQKQKKTDDAPPPPHPCFNYSRKSDKSDKRE